MDEYQHKESRIMKNQVNMTPSKETNRGMMTDPKETEIYELSDKDFTIILLKKFSEPPEHSNN